MPITLPGRGGRGDRPIGCCAAPTVDGLAARPPTSVAARSTFVGRAGGADRPTLTGVDHPAGAAYPRLVPSSLLPPEDPSQARTVRRTVRDWLVDLAAFVIGLFGGLFSFVASSDGASGHLSEGVIALDWALGGACCIALWWRRRRPVGVFVVTTALSTFSAFAGAPAVIALFTVAVHRRTSVALITAALSLASSLGFAVYRPQNMTLWLTLTINAAVIAIVTAWGMFVRARRQLVWTLRARADRAEAEQLLRAEQAQRAERTRIAREMHDVLAHRISMIALHAGGLELRPDLPTDQVRATAALLRETAHRALEELRGVIGVLRDDGEDAPAQPQPRLRDIPRLVDEIRGAGTKIDFAMAVPDGVEAPEALGRDAFRVVQEALTNVAKHARGTATTVRVSGGPGEGLAISVRNRLPVGVPAAAIPGSGLGLLGLQERVSLAGGTITSGPASGEFVVEARLAWP